MKVVLLNPPAQKKILRDYFCSESSKAAYYWPPIDLLVLSGMLRSFEIKVLDAMVDNLAPAQVLQEIFSFSPDWVISLVSAVGWQEEKTFFSDLKKKCPKIKIAIVGDIALFEPELCFQCSDIDAIIQDFTSKDIPRFLIQKKSLESHESIIYREEQNLIKGGRREEKEFSYPTPQHEIFPLYKYSLPYSRHAPMTTVMVSTYGCMYKCTFCPSGQIGFGYRRLENTLEELDHVQRLKIKEVYFRDFTLSAPISRLMELCHQIIKRGYSFKWSCDAVISNMNNDVLRLMKRAGCYLIFFGVESGQEEDLRKVHKPIKNLESIRRVFKECRQIGIETLASFILGLPYQDEGDLLNTIAFSKEIDPTYASFNLFVPRYGTPLRHQLKKEGRMGFDTEIDSSEKVFNLTSVSNEKLYLIHRKAIREFYMRPSYMWSRLRTVNSFVQLRHLFRNGFALLSRI